MPIPIVEVDPRDYLKPLDPPLTDAEVEAWRTSRTCLCGCGTPVTQRLNARPQGPAGSYRYFSRGHVYRRSEAHRNAVKAWRPDAAQLMKIRQRAHRTLINATMLGDLLEEHLAERGLSANAFAQQHGLDPAFVSRVRQGQVRRMRPHHLGRYLRAIGEELRPEIAAAVAQYEAQRPIEARRETHV